MSRYADYQDDGTIFCIIEGDIGAFDTGPLVEVGDRVSDDTHYIDMETWKAVTRKPFNPQYNISKLTMTLNNLPTGTEIRVGMDSMMAEGEDDEIEFDTPGTYHISLSHPRYLDETLEVSVG